MTTVSEHDVKTRPMPTSSAPSREGPSVDDRKRAPFQAEKPQEFRHRVAIAMAIAFSWCARVLPGWLKNWLADRSGDLFYVSFKTYRQNVKENVAQVLGLHVDDPSVRRTAIRIFRQSSRNFADMLLVPHKSVAAIASDAQSIEGDWSIIDDALALGKGAILVTGHVGSFDYIGQILGARGYPMNVMTTRTTARIVFDAVTYLRRSKGVAIIEATPSGVRKAMQALRRGECLVLATDRDFHLNGRPVTFFGKETTLPPGAARIGRETGAPLVPVFGMRLRKEHGVRILPAFTVPKTKDVEADIANGLTKIVDVLEQAIALTPDQWFMFQRVWPSGPAAPVRVFPIGSPLETDILERVGAALPGRRRKPAEP